MTKPLTINKPSVIVVIDDRARREAVAAILERHGARVERIDTLTDAITHAKRQPTAGIVVEFSSSTAVAVSVAVGHGLPIYAISFGQKLVPSEVMEAIQSGVAEVFESRKFGAQAEALVLELEDAGNRFAEQPGERGLAFGASAYQVEELSEMPSNLSNDDPQNQVRGLSLDDAGDASGDLPDPGLEVADEDSIQKAARGDGPQLHETFSDLLDETMPTDSTTQPITDALSLLERRVAYMLQEHERLLIQRVTRLIRATTAGNEIRIHEIASAISAQNSEEVMAGMLRVIQRSGHGRHSAAADVPRQGHPRRRNSWRTALKVHTRDLWVMAATTVVLVGALAIVQRFFL